MDSFASSATFRANSTNENCRSLSLTSREWLKSIDSPSISTGATLTSTGNVRPLALRFFDWKISAGLLSAFAAREVIISTMATLYSVGDESDAPLRQALVNDRYPDGRPVYTPLVAISLLVFFVFALQCMSTLAIARLELNSWLWPAVMWLYMTGLAWIASFVVYQGGLALGLG